MHLPEAAVWKPGSRKGRRIRPEICAHSFVSGITATCMARAALAHAARSGPDDADAGLVLPPISCRQNNSAEIRSAAKFLRSWRIIARFPRLTIVGKR